MRRRRRNRGSRHPGILLFQLSDTEPEHRLSTTSRAYYSAPIHTFLGANPDTILGVLTRSSPFEVDPAQRDAWLVEIDVLKSALNGREGMIFFEFSIPRMGRRIDAVVLLESCIFVLEFKVGSSTFDSSAIDQVTDYALDLKYFHESSRAPFIMPILISTEALDREFSPLLTHHDDQVFAPITIAPKQLQAAMAQSLATASGSPIDQSAWEAGRYRPTPTIIQAAMALYASHSVADIVRSDADDTNLGITSKFISKTIAAARDRKRKVICFVTGVPGAGKTLVGLDIATSHFDANSDLYSVYLSGNGPLVDVLREALARDRVWREREAGKRIKKGTVSSEVKLFIQNVHNFRDECLRDQGPPAEHVALFDEAQRAWNAEKTIDFMRRKKGVRDFKQSEPDFLISCMDRHEDWAVIVCLVGGGQEINSGEAGISEWVRALQDKYPKWHIYLSSRLTDSEYGSGSVIESLKGRPNVHFEDSLHLSVSMRSFRSEKVSQFVKQLLDIDREGALETLAAIGKDFPIVLTRDLSKAKAWLKSQARGSDRYGIVVSSQAERLRPHAIHVKSPVKPVHWFLNDRSDVRSSYYLEDVATEFHIQGLELDWVCTTWDADFRFSNAGWHHHSFVGSKWKNINQEERKKYLKNAYRVLLTRARQGMVICVPDGDLGDPTRSPAFYDSTYRYLREIGLRII